MRPKLSVFIDRLFQLNFLPYAVTLGIALAIGFILIFFLRRFVVGQTVREEGPKSHYKKSGTPTLGGIIFVLALNIMAFYPWSDGSSALVIALARAVLAFSLVGFIDDVVKLYKNKEGLSVKQKTVGLALLSLYYSYYFLYRSGLEPIFYLPFKSEALVITGGWKIVYLIFATVYIYFIVNAVNLTDGVDGLAGSVSLLVLLFAAYFANYSYLNPLAHAALRNVSLLLVAGLLAFLYFNRHPAKIFMGDTGSLGLGAGIALIYLYLGKPWLLLFVGIIYIVEALSVLLQVSYFKMTGGKRLFKMTPIHHHFELSNWSEKKIVAIFVLVTLIGGLISVLIP